MGVWKDVVSSAEMRYQGRTLDASTVPVLVTVKPVVSVIVLAGFGVLAAISVALRWLARGHTLGSARSAAPISIGAWTLPQNGAQTANPVPIAGYLSPSSASGFAPTIASVSVAEPKLTDYHDWSWTRSWHNTVSVPSASLRSGAGKVHKSTTTTPQAESVAFSAGTAIKAWVDSPTTQHASSLPWSTSPANSVRVV